MDVGGVAVVRVPGCFGGARTRDKISVEMRGDGEGLGKVDLHCIFKFAFVEALDFADGVHGASRIGG